MFPVLLPTPRVRGAAERGRRGSTGDVFIVLGSPALGGDFPRAFRYLGDNHLFVFHPDLLTVLYKVKGSEKMGHDAMGKFMRRCDFAVSNDARRQAHRLHTNGHRVRCRGSQRARLVRRAAPPGAPLCAVRSPRASHAAPRSSPSRREEAPDGTARARCGARIAEPRGRPAASRSCSSRCVSIHPPVPHVLPDRVASSNPNSDARTRELGRQHGRSTRGPDEIT